MIKLIILDFDGTLGDTRANIVLTMRMTLAKLGYPEKDEETIAATIGVPLEEGFEQMFPGISPADVALCASTYREVFEQNRKVLVPGVFPHVPETLAALKEAGYVLTIASSRCSKSLNEFLRDMGLAPYVSYVLGADTVVHAKPHPEPVLKTMADRRRHARGHPHGQRRWRAHLRRHLRQCFTRGPRRRRPGPHHRRLCANAGFQNHSTSVRSSSFPGRPWMGV